MKKYLHHTIRTAAARRLTGSLLLSVLLAASTGTSWALQIIPSVGYTKATDANAGDGAFSGGLALRAPLLPFLSLEGGVSYREESFMGNDLKVRMWPLTASAWLTPSPMLYAGGGVGWYRTTYDYASALPFEDVTSMQLGTHVGGGLMLPLSPAFSLDLHGRYIFMQTDNNVQFPTEFDPDFWTTSVGLAIKF